MHKMKFGLDLPNFGEYGDPHLLVDLAGEAENSGWEGFFLWDHIARPENVVPMVDPWIALSAIACGTRKIRIGTMVTPLARRRPWKVARETVSLDYLSGGRFILGVGLGEHTAEFDDFGEEGEPKIRAEMLDEGLEIITGLWKSSPFSFFGNHYQIKEAQFLPAPFQAGGIPIWVAGRWPNHRPFRRAAKYEGVFALSRQPHPPEKNLQPADFGEIVRYITENRQPDAGSFDVVHAGMTSGTGQNNDKQLIRAYEENGVTWWLERINHRRGPLAELRKRIKAGPPKY